MISPRKGGYWLGQTEVTQAAYQRVVGANPSHFKGSDLPVEMVDWNQAGAYCRQVGGRLPTEAEWERAARAGRDEARYGVVGSMGWYDQNSEKRTHQVATKAPNAYGLYDMLGNVREWTADGDGSLRVTRGGSWGNGTRHLRSSNQFRSEPGSRNGFIVEGFVFPFSRRR